MSGRHVGPETRASRELAGGLRRLALLAALVFVAVLVIASMGH